MLTIASFQKKLGVSEPQSEYTTNVKEPLRHTSWHPNASEARAQDLYTHPHAHSTCEHAHAHAENTI